MDEPPALPSSKRIKLDEEASGVSQLVCFDANAWSRPNRCLHIYEQSDPETAAVTAQVSTFVFILQTY